MTGNKSTNITGEGFAGTGEVVPSLVLTVGIASVVFNGALLIAMTFNSRKVFASLGSYFIYNLAIADFVTGVNSIVWGISELMPPEAFSIESRLVLLTIFWITVQVAFYTVFVMSTERLVAIVFPFKAALLMSRKKTTVYCIAVWILAVVCGGLFHWKIHPVQFFLTIVFEVVIVCIVIEYVLVFRQLRVLWQSSKRLGNNFTMEDLSNELNKPKIQKFERQKVIVNHINEIHSTDLVDMSQYSKINKGYRYIFTNIDVFSKYAYAFPLKSKKIQDIKPCFEKIFKDNKPKYIWSDKEPAFLSKEMQKFFKDNNVKIYHTNSHLKAVVIERFNRSLRELMMKEFVKNNNTIWYNILPKLIKIYNNRFHSTIKMKPIDVNKNNQKYIKENIYTYNKTSKNPKFKINDLVRISLKRRNLFDKPSANIKWSEELFKIHSINKSNVITYKLKT